MESEMSGSIPLSTVLRMHAAYLTPLSMREVGTRFGVGKTAAARAFRDWNLPVRPKGGAYGKGHRKPQQKRQSIAFVPVNPPVLKSFCGQCERRVSAAEARRCGARFCKAIPPSQRQGLAQQQGA